MTESGWLSCEDPVLMLPFLTTALPSGRKLRLFACACSLLLPNRPLGLHRSVEAALAFADGKIGASEMGAARSAMTPGNWGHWTVCDPDAGEAACYVTRDDSLTGRRAEMAALLRDVFGNPFRPALPEECYLDGHYCRTHGLDLAFVSPGLYRCPAGRAAFAAPLVTPAVQGVARRAYGDRDFAALLVLADALEEAGCEDADLLGHLRGQQRCPECLGVPCCQLSEDPDPRWREAHTCATCRGAGRVPLAGPHVAGCWALDLVLGKE